MRKPSHFRKSGALLCLSMLAALVVGGCLKSDTQFRLSYNPAKDEFNILMIYQHIHGDTSSGLIQGKYDPAADFETLHALWLNRDHLLLGTDIIPAILSHTTVPLRIDAHTFAWTDLGFGTLSSPISTPLPLDEIQIKPGALFLESPDNLCYYHQIVVPGKVVDQLLAQLAADPAWSKSLIESLDAELQSRQDGRPRGTWAELTRQTLAEIQKSGEVANADAPSDSAPRIPFDTDSIMNLKLALSKGTLPVGRRGTVFYLRLPLTEADTQSAQTYLQTVRKALIKQAGVLLQKAVADHKLTDAAAAQMRRLLKPASNTIKITPVGDEGLEISIDSIPLADLVWTAINLVPPETLDAESVEAKRNQEMATLAADRLPVDAHVRVPQIIQDFKASRLSAYPSDKPVEPGTDLKPEPGKGGL